MCRGNQPSRANFGRTLHSEIGLGETQPNHCGFPPVPLLTSPPHLSATPGTHVVRGRVTVFRGVPLLCYLGVWIRKRSVFPNECTREGDYLFGSPTFRALPVMIPRSGHRLIRNTSRSQVMIRKRGRCPDKNQRRVVGNLTLEKTTDINNSRFGKRGHCQRKRRQRPSTSGRIPIEDQCRAFGVGTRLSFPQSF